MIRCTRLFARLGLLVPLVVAAGCSSNGPATSRVTGVVLLDGEPLDRVEVVFAPEGKAVKEGAPSTALTDRQGRFVLQTEDRGESRDQVVAGVHRILLRDLTVSGAPVPDPMQEFSEPVAGGAKPRFSPRFSDARETPLKEVTIPEGRQHVVVELNGKTREALVRVETAS